MTTAYGKQIMIWTVAIVVIIMASTCLGRNILLNGEALYTGEYLQEGSYILLMQEDCNIVLYESGTPVWANYASPTGRTGCMAVMQADGNFVIYDSSNRAIWASNTQRGNGHYVLVLPKDRNVVIYGSDVWSTGTYIREVGGAVITAMNGTIDAGFASPNSTVVGGGRIGNVASVAAV